ncbi:hypothetical protein [Paraburkholderia sp. RAU2J]|uniref:hypothetical protein n=1 Tax=Paraburkholderia sp. RAU2J TaxID=1938810 RepID=UPI000EB53918|nr:hypothetical protein [Paraburkholderia sp. RAU2J]
MPVWDVSVVGGAGAFELLCRTEPELFFLGPDVSATACVKALLETASPEALPMWTVFEQAPLGSDEFIE